MARNHVLFTSLSRRKRRSATLKIKNLIYKERAVWGGVFYDECEHDAAVASGGWTRSDIVFSVVTQSFSGMRRSSRRMWLLAMR